MWNDTNIYKFYLRIKTYGTANIFYLQSGKLLQ